MVYRDGECGSRTGKTSQWGTASVYYSDTDVDARALASQAYLGSRLSMRVPTRNDKTTSLSGLGDCQYTVFFPHTYTYGTLYRLLYVLIGAMVSRLTLRNEMRRMGSPRGGESERRWHSTHRDWHLLLYDPGYIAIATAPGGLST